MASFTRHIVKVNQVASKVLTCGADLSSSPTRLILLVPGNPGLASIYEPFMSELNRKTKLPVWAVGHAGHDVAESDQHPVPSRRGNEHLYSLDGQIQHKIAFVEQFVPADCQVILVGHSIGCRIILDMMNHFDQVSAAGPNLCLGYLLFPVIERMYQSDNGPFYYILTAYLASMVTALIWIMRHCIPTAFLSYLIGYFVPEIKNSPVQVQSLLDFVHPSCAGNALYMAYTELLQLGDLDVATLQKFQGKLRLYYGASDGWCPATFCAEVKTKVSGIRAQLCQLGLPHAFVLGHSSTMADQTVNWLQADKVITSSSSCNGVPNGQGHE